MKLSQVAQFQELGKCFIKSNHCGWYDRDFVQRFTTRFSVSDIQLYKFGTLEKAWLRRLMHQYRHQIKVIKKNQLRENK